MHSQRLIWLRLLITALQYLCSSSTSERQYSWIGTTAPTNLWTSICTDAEGKILISAADGGSIYISRDAGVVWSVALTLSSPTIWAGIAGSASIKYLAAAITGGAIYISQDYGDSWESATISRSWSSIAMSASGKKIAATTSSSGGRVYLSSDYGSTFSVEGPYMAYTSIAISADGSFLAVVGTTANIYVSSDGGIVWYPRASQQSWSHVAISGNAKYLTATTGNCSIAGKMYTSSDYGVTWAISNISATAWSGIALSFDGDITVASECTGRVHISVDNGMTWNTTAKERHWADIALSYDGSAMIAATRSSCMNCSDSDGNIYRANTTFAPSTCAAESYMSYRASLCVACPTGATAIAGKYTCVCDSGLLSHGYGDDLVCSAPVCNLTSVPTVMPTTKPILSYITAPRLDDLTLSFLFGVAGGAFLCLFLYLLRRICEECSTRKNAVAAEEQFYRGPGPNARVLKPHEHPPGELFF